MRRHTHLVSSLAVATAVAGGLVTATTAASTADEADADYGRMLLLLDSSGSMAERTAGGGTKMKAAKKALTDVVRQLPEGSEVGLRVYGATVFDKTDKGACTDSQLEVPLGTDNRPELVRAISTFKPYGETPIAYALKEAAEDVGDQGKRSIVLVSDGIATCRPDPCEVAAELSASGIDLQIDVVGLGVSGDARRQLACIADKGNGTYYNVDSAQEISATLTRVSQRAVRPFTLAGTPVEGTTSPDDAPTITAGQWTDIIGGKGSPEAALHYRVERRIPDSTIHVVATTRGTVDKWDEISATLSDDLGEECQSAKDSRNIDQYSILAPQVMAGRDGSFPREECWKSDHLDLLLQRGNDDGTERAPVAITVYEEPPATGVEELPEAWEPTEYAPPKVAGAPRKLVAGAAFGDAPRVSSGVYKLDIVPGESQIVKVPLEWGQQFSVRAVFPAGTPGVEELTGVQGPFGDLKMYSSLGGAMSGAYVGTDSTAILPGADSAELTGMSPQVRYRNREAYGDVTGYLPGDYFVVISMNADVEGDTWVQPYRLAVEIRGEEGEGAPTYDSADTAQPLEEVSSSAVPQDGPGAQPDAREGSGSASGEPAGDETLPLAAVVGGGAAAAVLAVGLLLLRRRRRGA